MNRRLLALAALVLLVAGLACSANLAHAQTAEPAQTGEPQPPASQPAAPPDSSQPPPPAGRVLFSRDASSPPGAEPAAPPQAPASPSQNNSPELTDAERNALTFTAYDLDVHLAPASAGMAVRAVLTVRNDGAGPLGRLPLEITSSMHWDAFSISGAPLAFAARLLDTDADHTGQMQEAAVTLPKPLAAGASITLTALYSGKIPPSAERLERIGAPAKKALAADWDAIGSSDPNTAPAGETASSDPDAPAVAVALRGFGNVLWVPVAAPPLFLGDGARLFQAVGSAKLRQSAATVRLRLAIEYVGEPPFAAFFCGRREPLIAISDNPNLPVAESPGIATAEFGPHPLGFRTLNLFVASRPPVEAGTPANPALISAFTSHDDALPAYSAAASLVEPLLTDWLGVRPQTALTVLDHPGEPFEDDAVLVTDMASATHVAGPGADPATLPAELASSLVHSLTHAWIHSSHPWIDEGLAQFLSVLWTERTQGRAAALSALQDGARTLALAEPEVPASEQDRPANLSGSLADSSSLPSGPRAASAGPAGESLTAATGDLFYRTKAAAVWWMLRGIVGDEALKQALQAYRPDARLDLGPEGFERALETASHKDLRWFFNDWVYRDRGLPDLNIVEVTPSRLDSSTGQPAGWLVAVVVRNDGYAAAEVPVTVRSADATETQRLRIPGRSSASTRIVFAGTPEEVQVNDGGVPETRTSIHTRQLVLHGR